MKTIYGVPEGAGSYAINNFCLSKSHRAILYIAKQKNITSSYNLLQFLLPDYEVVYLPAWDLEPFTMCSPNKQISAQRMYALYKISNSNKKNILVISSHEILYQKIPPKDYTKESAIKIHVNDILIQEKLIEELTFIGYERTSTTTELGEFSVRGGILDIYDLNSQVRIDFLGNKVDSIRELNTESQINKQALESVTITPVTEINTSHKYLDIYNNNATNILDVESNTFYDNYLSNQNKPIGIEHYLPLFFNKLESITEYLSEYLLLLEYELVNEIEQFNKNIIENIEIYNTNITTIENKHKFLDREYMYNSYQDVLDIINTNNAVSLSPFRGEDSNAPYINEIFVNQDTQITILTKKFSNKKLILCCHTKNVLHMLANILDQTKIDHNIITNIKECVGLSLTLLNISISFETDEYVFISTANMFAKKNRRKKIELEDYNHLSCGNLITHEKHGIGRFVEITTQSVNQVKYDLLKIIYKNDDVLYVPIQNINIISLYKQGADEQVDLDKLGNSSWQTRKKKINIKIQEMAAQLIKNEANRKIQNPIEIEIDDIDYKKFCDDFPHTETEDQLNAIQDVVHDIKDKNKIMNRLICGDVGFGKTEIAMHTAFLIATNGYQVALVTPTTILCKQHLKTFQERFKRFNLRITQLSSTLSTTERKQVLQELQSNKIDIIIGTHSLLSKQIKFCNLGLVIVDEEHTFGVMQKERLKTLRNNTHLLYLSATPIPRTLQMSMIKIYDISLISTPPLHRLPVKTKVISHDYLTIVNVINKEIKRNGQVLFVSPKISGLEPIHIELQKLMPSLRISLIHGKMDSNEINKKINMFYQGSIDLLLSTNIIESGIDIPNANTMIIDRANLFGLTQLYQLKGRVGRGKQKGYCYFMINENTILTEKAKKRLRVLEKISDQICSNFNIASHDMDIRGFGNILGKEQSGHIKGIGINLYNKMLKEALSIHNKEANSISWDPEININISLQIDESYISDIETRLELYQRIGAISNESEITILKEEMNSRFGNLPESVQNIFKITKIKILCKFANIESVDISSNSIILSFKEDAIENYNQLLDYIIGTPQRYKIVSNNSVKIIASYTSGDETINTVQEQLKILAEVQKT